MPMPIAMFVSTAAAGFIAGGGLTSYLTAAICAALVSWLPRIPRRNELPGFATLDPDAPDGKILQTAFHDAIILARTQKRPVRLRVTIISTLPTARFSLDLDHTRDLVILADGKRPLPVKLPGIVIPDFPLPAALPQDHCATFLLHVAGPEALRVRIQFAPDFRLPPAILCLLGAASFPALALNLHMLTAALLGITFQSLFLQHRAHGAPSQP